MLLYEMTSLDSCWCNSSYIVQYKWDETLMYSSVWWEYRHIRSLMDNVITRNTDWFSRNLVINISVFEPCLISSFNCPGILFFFHWQKVTANNCRLFQCKSWHQFLLKYIYFFWLKYILHFKNLDFFQKYRK